MAKGSIGALLVAAAVLAIVAPASAQSGFIRVSNGQFVDDKCNPFYFSGYNTWQILETAGGFCCGGRASVMTQLDAAQKNNLTVVRLFAYGVQTGYQLQTVPGSYNESAFKDLDFVVSEAGKRSLKLIVSLASNWVYGTNSSGTKCWYTNYTNTANSCDDFYTDVNAIQLYKDWIKVITSRVNTVTNLTYGADPTIFAWNLINEGRCDNPNICTAANIQSWITTVAPVLKASVSQLVTVGEDGFLQASNCLADKINPVTNNIGWPLQTGQDFLPNHAVDGIDYGSIHFWPDNWARVDLDFGRNWLTGHANLSALVLKKPLVVEEFGKAYGGNSQTTGQGQTEQQQVDYYKLVYSLVESSINTAGVIKGVAFWRWAEAASPNNTLAPFDNAATIATTSTTFSTVVGPFSTRVAQQNTAQASPVAGCTAATSTTRTATPPASSVAGRRLLQTPAAGPAAATAASINAQVPANLCGAYPPQPSSVG